MPSDEDLSVTVGTGEFLIAIKHSTILRDICQKHISLMYYIGKRVCDVSLLNSNLLLDHVLRDSIEILHYSLDKPVNTLTHELETNQANILY